MGKKKGGKRLGKKQVSELLQNLFQHPSVEDARHRHDGGNGLGRLPEQGW